MQQQHIPKQDLLIEIGTEELPPKSLWSIATAFGKQLAGALESAALHYENYICYATPRRLAIYFKQLEGRQIDRMIERRGPAVTVAFDEQRQPTQACLGFAKSCGIDVSQLQTLETDKGSWVIAQVHEKGKTLHELLPFLVDEVLKKLPTPKPMRWGNGDILFIRPVHWIVMLWGDEHIAGTVLGVKADSYTYGHRFLSNSPSSLPNAQIAIQHSSQYVEQLLQHKVMVDYQARRALIEQEIKVAAQKMGGTALFSDSLLDEVTSIVEWPTVLVANFNTQFLKVPKEALIAEINVNQKCFAMEDSNKKLLPHFIFVSNIEITDSTIPQAQRYLAIIHGNERVMSARLSDAAFFYEQDLKHDFVNYLEKLKPILFQKELGTMFDKAQRIAKLAAVIAHHIQQPSSQAQRAGLLAKCDLVSDMVGEFPELQGIMGRYYALAAGEDEQVAQAIEDHYKPRFADDELPTNEIGCTVALADRIDNLIGMFSIRLIPTGDKDPYALRRAALGIVKIIIEKQFNLPLTAILTQATQNYADNESTPHVIKNSDYVIAEVLTFIKERLRVWYGEQGYASDVVAAVLANALDSLFDVHQRILAVTHFRELPAAQSLAAANKRVSRILQKELGENAFIGDASIDQSLLMQPEEQLLGEQLAIIQQAIHPLCVAGDYTSALKHLSELQHPIDRFFDNVMVMVDDSALRANRLALLSQLRRLFLQVADISLLQG
ncbi:MAG: glycine--tRNA ligase subunit beta [Gammaproteobacteria bacterium]